jgi:predicted transcriptional regulator
MFAGLIEAQARTDERFSAQLAASDARLTAAHESLAAQLADSNKRLTEAHLRTEAAIEELAAAASRYITSSDERMKRLEANLDGLIEAITREHSNGKKRGGE